MINLRIDRQWLLWRVTKQGTQHLSCGQLDPRDGAELFRTSIAANAQLRHSAYFHVRARIALGLQMGNPHGAIGGGDANRAVAPGKNLTGRAFKATLFMHAVKKAVQSQQRATDARRAIRGAHFPDDGGLCRIFLPRVGMVYDRRQQSRRNCAMIGFKGSHFERDVILWGVRWYVAYPMSYRQLEEMMEERGVEVDHSTLNRWVVKYAPLLEKQFRAGKRAVGSSWRLDETYVKVKGCWKYLYRAVDKTGATVDFLLTAKRDHKAALRFLRKAIGQHGEPEKITIDKSGANTAAIESYNAEYETDIEIRRIKYLNNIVEQDHRAVKRVTRPMLGFKSFRSAAATLSGIELTHMIRKGQSWTRGKLRPAQQFYALAA
jgi:putative transposase